MTKELTLKERIKDALYDFVPFEQRREELASILVDLVEDWHESEYPPLEIIDLGGKISTWVGDGIHPSMKNIKIVSYDPTEHGKFEVLGYDEAKEEDDESADA